jgi:hypothetical protein
MNTETTDLLVKMGWIQGDTKMNIQILRSDREFLLNRYPAVSDKQFIYYLYGIWC